MEERGTTARELLLPYFHDSEAEQTGWRPKTLYALVPPTLFVSHAVASFILTLSADNFASLPHIQTVSAFVSKVSGVENDWLSGEVSFSLGPAAPTLLSQQGGTRDVEATQGLSRSTRLAMISVALPLLFGNALALLILARSWFAGCPYIKLGLAQQTTRVGRQTNPSILNDVYPQILYSILAFVFVLILSACETCFLLSALMSFRGIAVILSICGAVAVSLALISYGILFISDLAAVYIAIGFSILGGFSLIATSVLVDFPDASHHRPLVESLFLGIYSRSLAAVPFLCSLVLLFEMIRRFKDALVVLASAERHLRLVQIVLLCAVIMCLAIVIQSRRTSVYWGTSPLPISIPGAVYLLLGAIAAVEFCFAWLLFGDPCHDVKCRLMRRLIIADMPPICPSPPGTPLASARGQQSAACSASASSSRSKITPLIWQSQQQQSLAKDSS